MAEQIIQQTGSDIFDAVQCGDVTTVKKYLEEGVPVDLTDEGGWSLLHHAAALGQVEVITLLREKGCRVDPVDNEGRTPLHYAATNGDIETIRLLTAMGSNVNSVDNDGNTPLQWSVMCEQYTAIEELIKHGGTVDNEEPEPPTECARNPIVIYHIHGSGELVREEIYPGNQTTHTTETVIHNVGSHVEFDISHNHGSDDSHQTDPIAIQPSKDTTADTTEQPTKDIFEAAQCGDTNTVKEYLDLGVPVDVTNEDGWSPVHHALAYRQVEVIRLLMDRGCLMNPVQKRKKTPQQRGGLHTTTEGGSKNSAFNENPQYDNDVFDAARCGDTDTVKAYLDLGIPVNLTDEDGRTILHCAAGEGQIKVVELLIERGCCIDPVDTNGWTPSISATACGHIETVQLLQKLREPCEEQYSGSGQSEMFVGQMLEDQILNPLHFAAANGDLELVYILLWLGGTESMTEVAGTLGTPLHQAVANGHKNIVSLLLNEGCPINVVDSEGKNLLHYAIQYGHIDFIGMLAEQGLDVNVSDNEGRTPLHYAVASGQLKTVCTLLRLGGRKSMTKVAGALATPLHQAVARGHKDIVSLLLKKGCPINVQSSKGVSIIHTATEFGHVDLIEMLAGKGLDVNIGDNDGITPLHTAAASGRIEVVLTLLRLGGRKSMTTVAGTFGTPLHAAVAEGHKDVVSLLLNEGCPINVVDSEGYSVLHIASTLCHIDLIEMLAGKGLDINIGNNESWTPLHMAAKLGELESVRTLLRLGGKESMAKVAGTAGTPLQLAVREGHKDIVLLLLKEGCSIDIVTSEGFNLLHFAAVGGQIDMIEFLTGQGLDVNIGDDKGRTPLHEAAANGQLEAVRTLLRLGGKKSITKVAGGAGIPLHQAVKTGHKDIVSLLLNEVSQNGVDSNDKLDSSSLANFRLQERITPLMYAATAGEIEIFEELVRSGGDIHLLDEFGMNVSDWILMFQGNEMAKQFCKACGYKCGDEGLLDVISTLSSNKLLDTSRILCLAAVLGNVLIFDAMVTSQCPLDQQKMSKIGALLSFFNSDKKLPFYVSEEPLTPLHISLLSVYFQDLDEGCIDLDKIFIEKLTSHPRTRYTVNELFPNGLSPLDVARQFELRDIVVIIEKAGGKPGVWADLPKEIKEKCPDLLASLKELRGKELGDEATSTMLTMLGFKIVDNDGSEVRTKILKEKPTIVLIDKHFLWNIKNKNKWKRVGRQLHIGEEILKKLNESDDNEDDIYYSMLEHWLENGHNVSWKSLIDSVSRFELKRTIDDIIDKLIEELAPSQVIGSLFLVPNNNFGTVDVCKPLETLPYMFLMHCLPIRTNIYCPLMYNIPNI